MEQKYYIQSYSELHFPMGCVRPRINVHRQKFPTTIVRIHAIVVAKPCCLRLALLVQYSTVQLAARDDVIGKSPRYGHANTSELVRYNLICCVSAMILPHQNGFRS